MKKKGFTFVELLAVIAILAILVIVAMPNVLGMFNQAKSSTFVTEVQEYLNAASTKFMTEALKPGNQGKAFWQQIAFEFIIPEVKNPDEIFLGELAYKCESSNGAVYGIDDIQVF